MSRTKISWADFSWSPIVGCSKVSAGCANCYAERMAIRLRGMGQEQYSYVVWPKHFEGAEKKRGWNGKTFFVESALTKPLHWKKPRKIFVVSMGDLFHESVDFEWIDRIFAVMAVCPQHRFMCLTKRAGRMREYMADMKAPIRIAGAASQGARTTIDLGRFWGEAGWPPKNIHLGVTVENQDNVGRILDLVKTPAAKRFLSIEPLLGRIDCPKIDAIGRGSKNILEDISCAFIGCESGPKARLCTLDDIRYVMDQCREAGVKIHIKQCPIDGKCNKNISQWPPEFQIRED